MRNICLHSIYPQYDTFDTEETLEKLETILKTRSLLCRRLLGMLNPSTCGFNGLDYISLCDYDNRNNPPYNNDENYTNYNSYQCYIEKSISLMINKSKIKTIKPILVAPIVSTNSMEEMRILGFSKTTRYSDMPDEVQVKGRISLDALVGITIPTKEIINMYKDNNESIKIIMELISKIDILLKRYGYDAKIYDLETFTSFKGDEDTNQLSKRLF